MSIEDYKELVAYLRKDRDELKRELEACKNTLKTFLMNYSRN